MRPDGYSFHLTQEAEQEYLAAALKDLPPGIPDEYSFPCEGWRLPATATPVKVPEDSLIGKALRNLAFACFVPGDTEMGREYQEAQRVQVIGDCVSISYGEKSYDSSEQELLRVRREIEERLEQGDTSPLRAIQESEAMIRYLGFGDSK